MDQIQAVDRIFESSPVIVIVLLAAVTFLWKHLQKKDEMLLKMQNDMMVTVRDNTEAVRQLTQAIENRRN